MTIYTITLTNKKTGRDISRDYDLDEKDTEEYPNIIDEMKTALEEDDTKKV